MAASRMGAVVALLTAVVVWIPPACSAFAPPTSTSPSLRRSILPASNSSNNHENDPVFRRRNQQWVVLVDDEESIRYAVGDFLYDRGYEVTACADAASLLDLIAVKNSKNNNSEETSLRLPDIIVSDVRMPESDKNGYELVEFLRSAASEFAEQDDDGGGGGHRWKKLDRDSRVSLSNLPVVLLTAKAMTEDRIRGYRAGADVVLPKPFSPEELVAILDNLIRNRQRRLLPRPAPGGAAPAAAVTEADLRDLRREIESIRAVVTRNAATTVRKTDVVLSDRERKIVELLAEGSTAREIAASLRQRRRRPTGNNDDGGADPQQQQLNQPPPTKEEIAATKAAIESLRVTTGTATKTDLLRWARKVGYLPQRSNGSSSSSP